MKKIAIANLNALFSAIAGEEKLYLPISDSTGQTAFALWAEGAVPALEGNAVRSAKDSFFPQV